MKIKDIKDKRKSMKADKYAAYRDPATNRKEKPDFNKLESL